VSAIRCADDGLACAARQESGTTRCAAQDTRPQQSRWFVPGLRVNSGKAVKPRRIQPLRSARGRARIL